MNTTRTAKTGTDTVAARPWRRALLWLALLGPFFFISYSIANTLAAHRSDVGSIVFEWEHVIPFMAWTIVPYWIIDALYGVSLFVCKTKAELDSHAKRLLTAQIIAVICFILFPLSYSFTRPATEGIAGAMFTALTSFDKPFNQAPSLHIALLIILWVLYLRHVPRKWQWLLHSVCGLIGISVLTTYQHHFIDIPTGLLLGWLCVWLWPQTGPSPLQHLHLTRDRRRWRIAAYYFTGAMLASLLAFYFKGTVLWLLWPAVSLLFVASFYLLFGSGGFQKQANGKLSSAANWLLWPYLLGAKFNSRVWTRGDRWAVPIKDGVWLGRFPSREELAKHNFTAVIDLTAELAVPTHNTRWHALPQLDLVTPAATSLVHAAELIEQLNANGPVLVVCALGYSRSVLVILTWLLRTQRVSGVQEAIASIKALRPGVIVRPAEHAWLEAVSRNAALPGGSHGE